MSQDGKICRDLGVLPPEFFLSNRISDRKVGCQQYRTSKVLSVEAIASGILRDRISAKIQRVNALS